MTHAEPISIVDLLTRAAEREGSAKGFSFYQGRNVSPKFVSYAELYKRAAQTAAALRGQGVQKGACVGIALFEQEEFVCTFLGCILAGIIAVPLPPPRTLLELESYKSFIRNIASITAAPLYVASKSVAGVLSLATDVMPRQVITYSDLQSRAEAEDIVSPHPGEIAFLQFTSGSTATPKGVIISHRNVCANIKSILKYGIEPNNEILCSWLPFYHDMGLIGCFLSPLALACSAYYLNPLEFLKRPLSWLKCISTHRCTISFAPNFAYALCAKRAKDDDLKGLDLSSWRFAGCGAEPIHAESLNRFTECFQSAGFKAEYFKPSYGLAESTLAVAITPRSQRYKVDSLSEIKQQADGNAGAGGELFAGNTVVSSGRPFPDHDLKILDEQGKVCSGARIGEIYVRGPSVSAGYYRNEEATAETFIDGWLKTGDLGYLKEGTLYVCGRKKELIIVAGRNFAPTDLEAVTWKIPGLRKGNVIAFSVVQNDGEGLVIAAEVERRLSKSDQTQLQGTIERTIVAEFGVTPFEVVLLPGGTLPKTTSGKLRRLEARRLYQIGELYRGSLHLRKQRFFTVMKHLVSGMFRH